MIGLTLYYAGHTLKNSIRRMLRSKAMLVFVLVFAAALVVGFVAGNAGEKAEVLPEEVLPEEELTQGDVQEIRRVTEVIAGGILLASLLISLKGGEKSGADIFPMSDVNFLFSAPRKPQAILMFRLVLQLGAALVGSIYLLFQLPNLILNLGLTLGQALWIFSAWILMLVFGKIFGVWVYIFSSNHPRFKRSISYICLGVPCVLAAVLAALALPGGMGWWPAAKLLFASPASRLVPVWGWIKGIVAFSLAGEGTLPWICLAGTLAAGAVMTLVIWRMKADFYEDALVHATDVQKLVNDAKSGMATGRKRSEKLQREGFSTGTGETMFFIKAMYNRRRFAKLGVFTKTQLFYGAAGIAMGVILRFFAESRNVLVPGILLTLLVYFRNYGNPISEEEQRPFLYLVPAPAGKKLLWCVLAGTCQTLLDLAPGLLLLWAVSGANILSVLSWGVLAGGVDLLASAAGLVLELELPEHLGLIRGMLQFFLKLLALLPAGVLLLVGGLLDLLWAAVPVAGVVSALLGWLMIEVSKDVLHYGRK